MSVPTTNDGVGVLDYAQTVLELYLADELATRNADRSLSVQVPDRYRRVEQLPAQMVGTDCALYFVRSTTTTAHDAAKRNLTMVVQLVIAAQAVSAMSDDEKLAHSIVTLAEAVELVLHSAMRSPGGDASGVASYRPEAIEYSPPLRLTPGGVWGLGAQVRGVVHQNPYRITL